MPILKEEFHSLLEKSNSWGDGILELTDWLKNNTPDSFSRGMRWLRQATLTQ